MDSIKLTLAKEIAFSAFIQYMLEVGWDIDDHGKVRYLPLGDNGMFEWQTSPKSSWHDIYDIILTKEDNGELLGITLVHKESKRGGIFHIDNKSIQFFPTINRKTIFDKHKITDFSWYIVKLLRCVDLDSIRILKIEMDQIYE